jgi:DNA-binding NtrC family response regulator
LLVEPDAAIRQALTMAVERSMLVDGAADFEAARTLLSDRRYDLIVSNLRLAAYNGLHLILIATLTDARSRAVVYDNDVTFARDVQRAGAFFELTAHLPVTLPAYVEATLPTNDRRDPTVADRRSLPRGGRRLWDLHVAPSMSAL